MSSFSTADHRSSDSLPAAGLRDIRPRRPFTSQVVRIFRLLISLQIADIPGVGPVDVEQKTVGQGPADFRIQSVVLMAGASPW